MEANPGIPDLKHGLGIGRKGQCQGLFEFGSELAHVLEAAAKLIMQGLPRDLCGFDELMETVS